MNRRWPLVTGLFIAGALLVFGVRHVLEVRAEGAKKTRELAYEAARRSYSEALKPGATRKEVEDYLGAKNVEFRRMCCVDSQQRFSTNVYDDLTKVGQENAPWYCSENNIYVAFQFTGPHRGSSHVPEADASDTLRGISLFPWCEDCLRSLMKNRH
jgi:hypothetical protein